MIVSQQPATAERMEVKIPGQLPSFWVRKIPSASVPINGKQTEIKEFWIGETEITWDIYDIYAFRLDLTEAEQAADVDGQSRPSRPYGAPDRGFGHKGFAALGMTHHAAGEFCNWLARKTGLKFRVPTTLEWEYAARAGATQNPSPVTDFAWCWENSDDKAHEVGTKKPNAWGLHDMLGNVQEWATDEKGKPVTCGGSYMTKAAKIGFATREPYSNKWQDADAHVPKSKWWLSDGPFVGMRVVIDP